MKSCYTLRVPSQTVAETLELPRLESRSLAAVNASLMRPLDTEHIEALATSTKSQGHPPEARQPELLLHLHCEVILQQILARVEVTAQLARLVKPAQLLQLVQLYPSAPSLAESLATANNEGSWSH